MTDVPFPRRARWTQVGHPALRGQMRGRQMSIAGAEAIVPTLTGHWVLSGRVSLPDDAAQLEWSGFLAQMQGGIGTTLVPIYNRNPVPYADGTVAPPREVPELATAEHWIFQTTRIDTITLASAAQVRDTELALTLVDSLHPRPGHLLSIGDRFHRVQRAWTDGTTPYVQVQPPLREAHTVGTRVETVAPVCRMRLTGEDVGEITETPDGIAFVDVSFVEAL